MSTIQSEDTLNALLPDNQERLINPEILRSLNTSIFAVGGLMSCRAVDGYQFTQGWQEPSFMTDSSDTKGVQEDLTRAVFSVDDLSGATPPGDASGAYRCDAWLAVIPDITIGLRMGYNLKGVLETQYRMPDFVNCPAGVLTLLPTLIGGGRFNANQEAGLVINCDTDMTLGSDTCRISMAQFTFIRQ